VINQWKSEIVIGKALLKYGKPILVRANSEPEETVVVEDFWRLPSFLIIKR